MRLESDFTPVLLAFLRMSLMKMSAGNLLWSFVLPVLDLLKELGPAMASVARHSGYAWNIDQSVSRLSSQAVIVVNARSDASLGPLKHWMRTSRFLLWTTGPLYVFFLSILRGEGLGASAPLYRRARLERAEEMRRRHTPARSEPSRYLPSRE